MKDIPIVGIVFNAFEGTEIEIDNIRTIGKSQTYHHWSSLS